MGQIKWAFSPGLCWLGWPVGFCVQRIKLSWQENIKDVIPSGISGRLPKELFVGVFLSQSSQETRCEHANVPDWAAELRKVATTGLSLIRLETWVSSTSALGDGKLPEAQKKVLTSAKVARRSVSCFSWRVGVEVLLFGKIFLLKLPDLKQVVGAFHQKAASEVADTLKGPIFSTHVWRKEEKADLTKHHVAQCQRLRITSCSFWFFISSAMICYCGPPVFHCYHSHGGKSSYKSISLNVKPVILSWTFGIQSANFEDLSLIGCFKSRFAFILVYLPITSRMCCSLDVTSKYHFSFSLVWLLFLEIIGSFFTWSRQSSVWFFVITSFPPALLHQKCTHTR